MGNYQRRCWLFAIKENTGSHPLDSGGALGRHWQRNAKLSIADAFRDGYKIQVGNGWWNVSLNVLHYLESNFTIDRPRTCNFHKFALSKEMEDSSWDECLEAFVRGRGGRMTHAWYTYNDTTILSQDLLIRAFMDASGEGWYAVSTHNGCDARGGFSRPFLCRIDECDLDNVSATYAWVYCEDCYGCWMSDDAGYNWYRDGNHHCDSEDFGTSDDGVSCPKCGGPIVTE